MVATAHAAMTMHFKAQWSLYPKRMRAAKCPDVLMADANYYKSLHTALKAVPKGVR